MADDEIEPGKVYKYEEGSDLPTSSLADVLAENDEFLADAVVLRGYLGRSPILGRTRQYLDRAKAAMSDAGASKKEIETVQGLLDALEEEEPEAQEHVPYRIYLSPRLNRYVDFHSTALLAWRQEPRPERRDTYTVWLRPFDPAGKPIPYRVVEEAVIGPSYASYLGGDLLDDLLGHSGGGGAWGDQTSIYGGGRPGTGKFCLGT